MTKVNIGNRYRIRIWTGHKRGPLSEVVVTVVKDLGGGIYDVEFPHPTVRRFTAHKIVLERELIDRVC